jgi:2-aminoadipate transaminase
MDWNNIYSSRMERVKPSAIMELIKVIGRKKVINFASGLPDASLFPTDDLREIQDRILQEDRAGSLQYGPAEGYLPLREWVAESLHQRRLSVGAGNILITHGSQQAIDLVARILLEPEDVVVLETPTYLAALQAFDSYGALYSVVPMDGKGMRTSLLPGLLGSGKVKLIYTLPNYQNPTGITMSAERREELVQTSQRYGVPILSDEAYIDLRYDGDELPMLHRLGKSSNVISTGTFSKTIVPGIRVGWVVAPEEVVEKLSQVKQITDLHSNSFAQRVVYRYCEGGKLPAQIERLRSAYRGKRDALVGALDRYFYGLGEWYRPSGGMFMLIRLYGGYRAEAILNRALDEGVAFVPGSSFFPDGGGDDTIRLNFVSPPLGEIEDGIKRLAQVVKESK